MKIKLAKKENIEEIMRIYSYAQDFMIKTGNPTQWGHFYPTREMIEDDLEKGIGYVVTEGTEIVGVVALCEGDEPTYREIYGGSWLNDEPYITIHRIAGNGRAQGVFDCVSDYCKSIYDNVRLDTHRDNTVMQRLIERSGYARCGTVYMQDGTARIAYHWVKNGENKNL